MLILDTGRVTAIIDGWPRSIPRMWWDAMEGPKPPSGWRGSNGCTASPDRYFGHDLWPACYLHDWAYSPDSGPHVDRAEADHNLKYNLSLLLRLQGAPWYRRWYVSFIYWRAVRRLGPIAWKKSDGAA